MFRWKSNTTFYTRINIQILEAPVNDHRANGLVERLIQTIKNRLACINEKKSKYNTFHVKHDEDTVMPEAILPDDKWLNGYCSDIVVELGMTRATRKANEREQASTDGESRFLQTGPSRLIPITEKAVKIKLHRKIHGKRSSKKNLKGLSEVLAPGTHISKVSPTTSGMKEPGKPIVTERNSDIANSERSRSNKHP